MAWWGAFPRTTPHFAAAQVLQPDRAGLPVTLPTGGRLEPWERKSLSLILSREGPGAVPS